MTNHNAALAEITKVAAYLTQGARLPSYDKDDHKRNVPAWLLTEIEKAADDLRVQATALKRACDSLRPALTTPPAPVMPEDLREAVEVDCFVCGGDGCVSDYIDEGSAGTVECWNCDGKGKRQKMPRVLYVNEAIERPDGSLMYEGDAGRFHARHKYILQASMPADWHEDSSLETWFPITAEELDRLRAATQPQPTDAQSQAALDAVSEWQIARATGCPDIEHEKATSMLKLVKAVLQPSCKK